VDAPDSMTRYGLLKTVAVISLPKTLPRRLTLPGTVFLLIGVLIPDVTAAGFVTYAELAALLLAFSAAVSPRRSERRWATRIGQIQDGPPGADAGFGCYHASRTTRHEAEIAEDPTNRFAEGATQQGYRSAT
jgi:hypothetical protein